MDLAVDRGMRFLSFALLAACASTTPQERTTPGTRGMRADAHLQAARAHEARAAELSRFPEMQRDAAGFDNPAGGLWYRAWDTAVEERRSAEHHRSEAARLQAAYEDACADVPREDITVSPFQRYGVGGVSSADGVVIMLDKAAGPPARLLAAMRCHRAWMMLYEAGMEDCPLDLAGIKVEAYGDESGISVEINATSPEVTRELQRRTAKDLEHSMAHDVH